MEGLPPRSRPAATTLADDLISFDRNAAPMPRKTAASRRSYKRLISTTGGLLSYLRGVNHQKILTLRFAQVQE